MTLILNCDNCNQFRMAEIDNQEPDIEKCPICGHHMTLLKLLYKSKSEVSIDEFLDIINYVDDEESYDPNEEYDSDAEEDVDNLQKKTIWLHGKKINVDNIEIEEDPCDDCDVRNNCLGSAIDCDGTPEECMECGVKKDCYCANKGNKETAEQDLETEQSLNGDMSYINEIMSSYEGDGSAAIVSLKKDDNIVVEIIGKEPDDVLSTLQTTLMSVLIEYKMEKQEVEEFMQAVTEELLATIDSNEEEE